MGRDSRKSDKAVGENESVSKGKIKVKKVPRGKAPPVFKKAWVGLELRTFCFESGCKGLKEIVSKAPSPPLNVYLVLKEHALEVLQKKNPEAAQWYQKHLPNEPGTCIAFEKDEVAEIEPVSPRL